MGVTVSCGGGFSKGLKGFFFSGPEEEDEGGAFGLLAREGEKRSWNWSILVDCLYHIRDPGLSQASKKDEAGRKAEGETYWSRGRCQDGNLRGVEIDVAIGLGFIEGSPH